MIGVAVSARLASTVSGGNVRKGERMTTGWLDRVGATGGLGKGAHMAFKDRIGLTKEQVRRIVLAKLKIVYRDWAFAKGPFWHREPKAGQRRIDPRSFETALLAALLGGLSEAIEKNNQVLFTALGRKDQRRKAHTKRRKR